LQCSTNGLQLLHVHIIPGMFEHPVMSIITNEHRPQRNQWSRSIEKKALRPTYMTSERPTEQGQGDLRTKNWRNDKPCPWQQATAMQ